MSTVGVQETVERIQEILRRPEVAVAMERFLAPAQRNRLAKATLKMGNKEAFVAIVGPQGAGKSSLLNGLLFEQRVLPVGEGTTTNVICFVRAAKGSGERCEVLREGLSPIIEPLETGALRRYVDEEENPGNEKGVRSITCYSEADLLRDNTVFVDTPGSGSLSSKHDDETMDFAPDISLAILLFRTTPPLTAGDAEFVSALWPICPEFLFVQNVWGESPEEVEGARKKNLTILAEIARQHGSSKPVSLLSIDVHSGLEGAANRDEERVEASGLTALRAAIASKIARGGQILELKVQSGQIIDLIQLAVEAASLELKLRPGGDPLKVERLRAAVERAEDQLRTLQREALEDERQFRSACDQALMDFQHSYFSLITLMHRRFEEEVSRGGYAGIEEQFLSEIKDSVSSSVKGFEEYFRAICQVYIERSSIRIAAADRMLAAQTQDLTGTHVAETLGKGGVFVGATTTTALTAMSAAAFGSVVAAGGGVGAGLTAAFAAVPGVGWAAALLVLGAGIVVRSVARSKRKKQLLDAFASIADKAKKGVLEAVQREAVRQRDAISAELRSRLQAGILQQEQIARRALGSFETAQENAKETEATLHRLVAALVAAATEIEGLREAPA